MFRFGNNPKSFRNLQPLYTEAENGLRKLLRQKMDNKYNDARSFKATFAATKKYIITITFYYITKKDECKKIFSKEVHFNYTSVMSDQNGKPYASKSIIKVHGETINPNDQQRVLSC